jgi:hypothetical protein
MGTLQEEFDRCHAYQTIVQPALTAVRHDWRLALEADATALAAVPEDGWDAWLYALDHDFDATHEPGGLDAAGQDAYAEACADIRTRAITAIMQRAREIVWNAGRKASLVTQATARLTTARTAYQAGATLDARWLVDLLMGVHLGLLAGGADAFEGTAQTLFTAARNFARDNAAAMLEVIEATAERPSDAPGLQTFHDARARLIAFIDGQG